MKVQEGKESDPDGGPGGDMKTEHTSPRMLRAELPLNSCTVEDWEMTARGKEWWEGK